MAKISDNEYYAFRSAIEMANSKGDKDALREIQYKLLTQYDTNRDIEYLLSLFRYTV